MSAVTSNQPEPSSALTSTAAPMATKPGSCFPSGPSRNFTLQVLMVPLGMAIPIASGGLLGSGGQDALARVGKRRVGLFEVVVCLRCARQRVLSLGIDEVQRGLIRAVGNRCQLRGLRTIVLTGSRPVGHGRKACLRARQRLLQRFAAV